MKRALSSPTAIYWRRRTIKSVRPSTSPERAIFGTLSGSPTGRLDRLFEFADNLSHQKGAHALRAGVDFLYNDLTITFPQSIRGSYAFSSNLD